jgi:hypothetical protein
MLVLASKAALAADVTSAARQEIGSNAHGLSRPACGAPPVKYTFFEQRHIARAKSSANQKALRERIASPRFHPRSALLFGGKCRLVREQMYEGGCCALG